MMIVIELYLWKVESDRGMHGFGETGIVHGMFNRAAVANLKVKLLDCGANANVY